MIKRTTLKYISPFLLFFLFLLDGTVSLADHLADR